MSNGSVGLRATTWAFVACLAVAMSACSGDDGAAGPPGEPGEPGAGCTATDNGDGTYTLDCDGDIIVVSDGTDGTDGADGAPGEPGTPCTVTDNGDGTYTLDCDGNIVIVSDGQDGQQGLPGQDGEDGEDLTEPPFAPWDSARPISKRVHAVHMGAELNYPITTVDYVGGESVPGRNWQLHFPQSIGNCQTCHPDTDTSGSWATNPNRLACWGCHDSDSAQAHYAQMTVDSTPQAPWSGDEAESCGTCHGENGAFAVTNYHGIDHYLSTGEFADCPPGTDPDFPEDCDKQFAVINITGVTVDAVTAVPTVDFEVFEADGITPIDNYDPAIADSWKDDLQFAIMFLQPADPAGDPGYSVWVPYIYEYIEVPSDGPWPNPAGTYAYMGGREDLADNPGGFLNNGGGSYSYTFTVDLDNVLTDVDGNPILEGPPPGTAIVAPFVTYDPTLTHRVAVWTGGHEGPTAEGIFDFRPDANPVTETRDIVTTAVCQDCHGVEEFHGHGGDRLTVEGCNMCHNESYKSPYNDESLGMAVMIHKIHAGGSLQSIPGADGIVWDDPETPADESADNGQYVLYRERGGNVNSYEWWNIEFPAVIENCTKCHAGGGADVDNWKSNPTRAVCGSCHDLVNFADGTGHAAGAQADDSACSACHPADGAAAAVTEAHDFIAKDPRATPEFSVALTVSGAAGAFFVAGEAPLVTIEITDNATGLPIDHTTVVEDDEAEGCTDAEAAADNCPPADGLFDKAYLFVHGPRAKRNPVLGTSSYADVRSATTGPFDLSAVDATLDLEIDGGKTVFVFGPGGDMMAPGDLSVAVADGTFVDPAAATAAEVVAWLSADDDFAARAVAWVEDGYVHVRSRNLGDNYSVKLEDSAVTTAVFGDDTDPHYVDGFYANNAFYQHIDPTEDDPKVTWTAANITYQLDPVDDLEPGTYVVSVEVSDRGRVAGDDYWAPAVDRVTFQVGTDTVEPPIAGNCDQCHQSAPGVGLVLDPARHNKYLGDDAIDQCGACHDYQSYR